MYKSTKDKQLGTRSRVEALETRAFQCIPEFRMKMSVRMKKELTLSFCFSL